MTDIDAFRYWRDQPDSTLADLRERLLVFGPRTAAQKVGLVLHSALQHAQPGQEIALRLTGAGEAAGVSVSIDCDADLEVLPLREHKIEKAITVPGFGLVQLVGKVDTSDAFTVIDYKTTRRFDPEALIDGMQWRIYLWLLDANRFVWEVFEVWDPLEYEPDVYRLAAHHRVEQWRYPGMGSDCLEALKEFCLMVQGSLPEYIAAKTVTDPTA